MTADIDTEPGLITEPHAARGVLGKCRRLAEARGELMTAVQIVRAQLALTEAIAESEKHYDQKIPNSN